MATATPVVKTGPRERLITTAQRLFAAEGIRSVGVDRVCAEAKVSKRSLYQHFSGKDEVVAAALHAQADQHCLGLHRDDGLPPRDRVIAVFERLDHRAGSPEFQGCPFIGAASELKDRAHPASVVAHEQKLGLTAHFADLLAQGGAREPDLLAQQLTLIFDGASVHGVLHGGATPATLGAVETLLAAHGM
jgi:AcrR family transcriptional regulator